jgi:hypothetical protein
MSSINNLSIQQLSQAANLKEKIVTLEKQLAQLLGATAKVAAAPAPKKKGGMSAAGKARIVAAQKARWAKIKAAKGKVAAPAAKPAKKKFVMSAAGKARIVAAQKARWAKIKAAKGAAPVVKVAAPAAKATKPAKKKFVMSAAAKAKISAAAKARWAKIKAAKK